MIFKMNKQMCIKNALEGNKIIRTAAIKRTNEIKVQMKIENNTKNEVAVMRKF